MSPAEISCELLIGTSRWRPTRFAWEQSGNNKRSFGCLRALFIPNAIFQVLVFPFLGTLSLQRSRVLVPSFLLPLNILRGSLLIDHLQLYRSSKFSLWCGSFGCPTVSFRFYSKLRSLAQPPWGAQLWVLVGISLFRNQKCQEIRDSRRRSGPS